jgi:hypothetical protein
MNEQLSTVDEAANDLGVRSDDLVALLLTAGIVLQPDPDVHGRILSKSDIAAITALMTDIHRIHKEGKTGIE